MVSGLAECRVLNADCWRFRSVVENVRCWHSGFRPASRLPQVALRCAAYVEITKQLQPTLCGVPRPRTPKGRQCVPLLWRLGRDSRGQSSQPGSIPMASPFPVRSEESAWSRAMIGGRLRKIIEHERHGGHRGQIRNSNPISLCTTLLFRQFLLC